MTNGYGYQTGDTAYVIDSWARVRPVYIVGMEYGRYVLKFTDEHGSSGARLPIGRLYPSYELAVIDLMEYQQKVG